MKPSKENRFIRHKSYVDARIDIIAEYIGKIDSLLIDTLIEHVYALNPCSDFKDDIELTEAIRDIQKLFLRWDILADGDLGGYILQSLSSRDDKKNNGQFFTPSDIVREMIQMISFPDKPVEAWKIFDPACGSGQFLICMFEYLLPLYILKGYSKKDAAKTIVTNNLTGNDIDPLAVKIARLNLSRLSGQSIEDIHISCHDFLFIDDLNTGQGLPFNNSHDIVIGNPPWGSNLSAEQKKYFRRTYLTSESGINTFTLFLERSFDFLDQHGQLVFLIPDAYLNIKAHQSSRQWLLDNFKIRAIALWGEQFRGVFAPSISIFLQKEADGTTIDRNIIEIHKRGTMADDEVTLVPQGSYRRNTEKIFNVHYSRRSVDILSVISNSDSSYLRDRSTFFLGIVTGNNQEHILPFHTGDHPDPIIIGKDLDQYRINFSDHYFKSAARFQQVAPRHLYQAKNKILYRFIGKKLTFAIDREGYFMLNNVNGLIPGIHELSIETIVSLLNSRVLQYYYEKTFFTLKVLRGNLEQLPLKKISAGTQRKIEKLIYAIMEKKDTESCIERDTLEDIFFHEYGLKDSDAHYIWDSLCGFSDGKSRKALSDKTGQVIQAPSHLHQNSLSLY